MVALVGPSGAGKSTIAQLVPRLYDPQAGEVRIDGHDIRDFTLDSLRRQISLELQETILFRGSVAHNIGYGRDGATREEIVAAAVRANAHEFIARMPDGYGTGARFRTPVGPIRIDLAYGRDTRKLRLHFSAGFTF